MHITYLYRHGHPGAEYDDQRGHQRPNFPYNYGYEQCAQELFTTDPGQLAQRLNDNQKTENKGHEAYDAQRLKPGKIYLLYDSLPDKTSPYLTFLEENIDEAGEKAHDIA
jgi:hypothetical protein